MPLRVQFQGSFLGVSIRVSGLRVEGFGQSFRILARGVGGLGFGIWGVCLSFRAFWGLCLGFYGRLGFRVELLRGRQNGDFITRANLVV